MRSARVFSWLSILVLAAPVTFAAPPGGAGDSETAWMGVVLGKPGEWRSGEDDPGGVPIRYVVEDGPAARAGLRSRDRITSVGGTAVRSVGELIARIGQEQAGAWLGIGFRRGDDERDARVRLALRPANLRELELRRGWIGVKAIDLPPALREHFGAPPRAGAMISEVLAGSPAEAAGLELGDVVFELDGEPVRAARHLYELVSTGGVGNELEVRLARAGVELTLEAVVAVEPAED